MHHIYTTPAFVVHSTSHGEAGKFLLLFTRDFGMIGAVAQGIRLAKSKLRYHVQDFSYCMVSIVRGKEVWRLTGAHEIEKEIESDIKSSILHIKILKLLKRLLQGEEKNEKLFEIVEALYKTDSKKEDQKKDDEMIECIIVLRILNILGYISTKGFEAYLENNLIGDDLIYMAKGDKTRMVNVINSALKESQL